MITNVDAVAEWLGRSATDPRLITAYKAAEAYVDERCYWDPGLPEAPLEPPADLVLAVCLQTSRYLERRDAPFGLVGMADGTAGRIGATDLDVQGAMESHLKQVLG